MGIKPDYPSTGYRYIKFQGNEKIKNIELFFEKPGLKKAKELSLSDNINWNSGIFTGKVEKLLNSIKEYSKETFINCDFAWNKKVIINKDKFILKKFFLKTLNLRVLINQF